MNIYRPFNSLLATSSFNRYHPWPLLIKEGNDFDFSMILIQQSNKQFEEAKKGSWFVTSSLI